MDKEKIADDLQTHSSSLTAIVEALGQVTALLKNADDQQRNYLINWSLPKTLDAIGQISDRLDTISADLKER